MEKERKERKSEREPAEGQKERIKETVRQLLLGRVEEKQRDIKSQR